MSYDYSRDNHNLRQRLAVIIATNEHLGQVNHRIVAEREAAEAERDALAEVVAAVRELHQPVTDDEEPRGPFCSTCRPLLVPWPCPTVRALAAVDRSTPAPTPETERPARPVLRDAPRERATYPLDHPPVPPPDPRLAARPCCGDAHFGDSCDESAPETETQR